MATCLHPIRVSGILVPCGKCPVCRQNDRQALTNRFFLEAAHCGGNTYFITLTYDDEHLPLCQSPNVNDGVWYPCYCKEDVVKLFKSLRKEGLKFSYFCTSERGDRNGRHHYHALMFMRDSTTILRLIKALDRHWDCGITTVSLANDSRFGYCAKYALKDDFEDRSFSRYDYRKAFHLYSRNPSIGKSAIEWLNEYIYNDGNIRTDLYINGKKFTFDRYTRNHIDPSLSAEVKAMTYDKNFQEIQTTLKQSKIKHSTVDNLKPGNLIPDYTEDSDIMKRRYRMRMHKKGIL